VPSSVESYQEEYGSEFKTSIALFWGNAKEMKFRIKLLIVFAAIRVLFHRLKQLKAP
jgi:hypothetical protein